MLEESGKVMSIDNDALWVETIQQSTCGSCRAKKGCGQQLLSKMGSASVSVRALITVNDKRIYAVGDQVTIGIPENVVVLSSLFVYCMPLLFMIAFSGFAHTLSAGDIYVVLAGFLGLFIGGCVIRYHAYISRNDSRYQAIILDKSSSPLTVSGEMAAIQS